MRDRHCMRLLQNQWSEGKFLCVGLDSDRHKLPQCIGGATDRLVVFDFNNAIIESTRHVAAAYKFNLALYLGMDDGIRILQNAIQSVQHVAPGAAVILDAKMGDVDSTNQHYADLAFNHLQADAVTVHPYVGNQSLRVFLERADKGVFVLCRTSGPGSSEFQTIQVVANRGYRRPLFRQVADSVTREWNSHGNCGLVMGATFPHDMAQVRLISPLPFLIPGVGAQGGDLKAAVQAGRDSRGQGILISVSRDIIFASSGKDFAEAAGQRAQQLHEQIAQHLKGV